MTTHRLKLTSELSRAISATVMGAVIVVVFALAFRGFLPVRAIASPSNSGLGSTQTVSGNNSGVVAGSINGPVTTYTNNNRRTEIINANQNEGILTPDHLPTPPFPPITPPNIIPPNALKVFLGSNLAWSTHMPHTILEMAGEPMIRIDRVKNSDQIVLTVLRIFDDRNNIIARIDQDGFWVENSTRNKRPNKHTLVVYDHTDTEVLRIVFLNKSTLKITGIFRHSGVSRIVRVSSDVLYVGNSQMSGVSMGENGSDISVN